jgi:hypothetical protein
MTTTTIDPTSEDFDPFEAAVQKRKKEIKEQSEKQSYSGSGEYDVLAWQGTPDNQNVVVRLLGKPYDYRTSNTDAKVVLFSKLLKDDAKGYSNIYWKPKTDFASGADTLELDDNWILSRLIAKVREGKWVKYPEPKIVDGKEKKGEFQYHHKDSKSFQRINNNKTPTDKYDQRVLPTPRIVMNSITRMSDICKNTKHSVLLSTDHNYWKDDDQGNPIFFTTPGIPLVVYDKIINDVVNYRKNWNLLDIVICKTKKLQNNKHVTEYSVKDAKDDKFDSETLSLLNANPLTEEELAYGRYDLDKYFSTTKYHKLLKAIPDLFKLVDIEFKTYFYEELVEAVRIEKEEFDRKNAEQNTTQHRVVNNETVMTENSSSKDNVSSESVSLTIEQQCEKYFPSWNALNDVDKKFTINGIDHFEKYQDGMIPIYKKDVQTIPCECTETKYPGTDKQPETVEECSHCFVCSKQFQVK